MNTNAGKVMPFSQAVLGKSPKTNTRGGSNNGTIVVPTVGMIDKNPSKPMAPSLRGKRVY